MIQVILRLRLASRKITQMILIILKDNTKISVAATNNCSIATVIIMHSRLRTTCPTDTDHNHTCKEDHLNINRSREIRKDIILVADNAVHLVTKM